MQKKRDCYEILGISKNASASAIKKAYRTLAKKYHPDSNPGDRQAEERFKEITESYGILSDPEKKKLYDQFGYAAFEGGQSGQDAWKNAENASSFRQGSGFGGFSGTWGRGGASSGRDTGYGSTGWNSGYDSTGWHTRYGSSGWDAGYGSSNWNFDGFSSGWGMDGDDIFSGMFGAHEYEGKNRKAPDLKSEVHISFDEAVLGCEKRIRLADPDTGKNRTLQVKIPAGIEDGKCIRLKGQGSAAVGYKEKGDLILQVKVAGKRGFERKGADIYTVYQVPFTTACFGGDIIVPTVYGDVSCKLKAGTQSGSKLRLRGKGAPVDASGRRGDQYVTIQIQVPKKLTAEQERKLREFEAASRKAADGVA